MAEVKAGMLFLDKDKNVFLVADSSNQRWVINIVTGQAKWLFKANAGTVEETEAKGYKYYMTAKELIMDGVPENLEVTEAAKKYEAIPVMELADVPSEYKPLSGFDKLLKEKLK